MGERGTHWALDTCWFCWMSGVCARASLEMVNVLTGHGSEFFCWISSISHDTSIDVCVFSAEFDRQKSARRRRRWVKVEPKCSEHDIRTSHKPIDWLIDWLIWIFCVKIVGESFCVVISNSKCRAKFSTERRKNHTMFDFSDFDWKSIFFTKSPWKYFFSLRFLPFPCTKM